MMSLLLFGWSAYADNDWRLRYITPNSETGRLTQDTSESTLPPSTTGYSGALIFANGFGVGCTTMTTDAILGSGIHKLQSDNLDISYTFGSDYSMTFGLGKPINGKAEATINGIRYVTENIDGDANFIHLGMTMLGIEWLFGFRQNQIEYRNYQGEVSGTAVTLTTPYILRSDQILVGFGLFF